MQKWLSGSCILFFGSGNCAIKTSLMISERHGYKLAGSVGERMKEKENPTVLE